MKEKCICFPSDREDQKLEGKLKKNKNKSEP